MANKKIQIIPPDGGYVDVLHPETSADQVKLADTGNNFAATNVEGALSELFTNVSNGKTLVATAITDKGIATSGSDTFSTMATNIDGITTGVGIGSTSKYSTHELVMRYGFDPVCALF